VNKSAKVVLVLNFRVKFALFEAVMASLGVKPFNSPVLGIE
jgi:hypothetical protein